jgi:hypothetical protein
MKTRWYVLCLFGMMQWQMLWQRTTASFSAGLRFNTDDLNDFLKPELKCVLPVHGAYSRIPSKQRLRPENATATGPAEGNRTGVGVKKKRRRLRQALPPPTLVARVTLSDCLACSGCVTSAEEILLDRHSTTLLVSSAANTSKFCVVSLSPQATASLAAAANVSFIDAQRRLATFFRSLGVSRVYGMEASAELARLEACSEFVTRFRRAAAGAGGVLPLLTSECPGFVLFIEKTHGETLLPHLSNVRSVQAISGTLVKGAISRHLQTFAGDANSVGDGGQRGTEFTCLTSATVQILTQKADRATAAAPAERVALLHHVVSR